MKGRNLAVIDACNECYEIALKLEKETLAFINDTTGKVTIKDSSRVTDDPRVKHRERNLDYVAIRRDERLYEVFIDKRNNVNTVIIHGNEKDKADGLVGTNNCAVVKLFGNKSYDYIKVDDFITRLQGFIAAAVDLHQSNPALTKEIRKIAEKAYDRIMKECDFYDAAHSIRDNSKDSGFLVENVTGVGKLGVATIDKENSKFERARSIINETMEKCGKLIVESEKPNELPSDISISDAVKKIQKHEVQVNANRGRPLDVKVSDMSPAPGQQTGIPVKVLSAEMPLGTKTLTSAHRTGNDPVTKLSNNVVDITAVYQQAGEKTGKFVQQLAIGGHSSYSPIYEQNDIVRLYVSYLAAKEEVAQLAAEELRKNPNATKVKVNVNAMMLLTPLREKIDKYVRKEASEYHQVESNQFAYEMLRNEKPFFVPINGRRIEVEYTVNYMNTPVNITKDRMPLADPPLSRTINARGIHDFRQAMHHHLDNTLQKKLPTPENIEGYKLEQETMLAGVMADLTRYHNQIPVKDRRDYINAVASVSPDNEAVISLNKCYNDLRIWSQNYYAITIADRKLYTPELIDLVNDKLRKKLADIDKSPEFKQVVLKELTDKISQIQKEIDNLKNPSGLFHKKGIDDNYLTIESSMREFYLARLKGDNETTQVRIDTLLRDPNMPLTPELREGLIAQVRFLRTENAFYTRYSRKDDEAFEVPVNFLLAKQSLAEAIIAFCKSGEDRTGALRVILLANIAFQAIYGHTPDLAKPVENDNYHYLLRKALEISAAIENTMHNGDARSLQINGNNITGVNISAGKMISKLHKKIYKEFKVNIFERAVEGATGAVKEKVNALLSKIEDSESPYASKVTASTPSPRTSPPPSRPRSPAAEPPQVMPRNPQSAGISSQPGSSAVSKSKQSTSDESAATSSTLRSFAMLSGGNRSSEHADLERLANHSSQSGSPVRTRANADAGRPPAPASPLASSRRADEANAQQTRQRAGRNPPPTVQRPTNEEDPTPKGAPAPSRSK